MTKALLGFLHATHLYRAAFWVAMVPIAVVFGFHTSVFVVFIYSTYANFIGDISAWEAKKAKEQAE
jgi:hypothetical protein